jgi:hypothetical protein
MVDRAHIPLEVDVPFQAGDAAVADSRQVKFFREKYNRFTMENARESQCKALRRREKSRRRKNNGKQ